MLLPVNRYWCCWDFVVSGGVGTLWLVVVLGLCGLWWCWNCVVCGGVGTEWLVVLLGLCG